MTEEEKKEFEEFLEWKRQKKEEERIKADQQKAEQSAPTTPSAPLLNKDTENMKEDGDNSPSNPQDDKATYLGLWLAIACLVIVIIFIIVNIKCSNHSSASYSSDVDTTYIDSAAVNEDVELLDDESTYTPTVEVKNSGWDGSVKQVKDYLKYTLRDPNSYESIEWSEVKEKSDGYYVRHKYRAKNGFGGYVVANQLFHLDFSGNVVDVRDLY